MKLLKKHLFIFAVIGVYFIVNALFNITCPIKYLLKIPCPTCGMTRAMLALVCLDFERYAEYNVMAFFVVVAVLLLIHRNVFQKKRWIDCYFALVMVANTLYYIMSVV